MTTHEMPQFLTPSRQETPSRQGLHEDGIEVGQSRLVDGLSRIENSL